jgi:uncharacterized sulfatase
MQRSLAIRLVCSGALLFWVPAIGSAQGPQTTSEQPPRRLNVLFIAVDDLNTRISAYGAPEVKTPNIDRLAARGVIFDRAYCQYPLCNPSRSSLLSGRRPDSTGVLDNTTPMRATLGNAVLLPEYFARHGYVTARVGKIAHGAFADAVSWTSPTGQAERAGPDNTKAKGKGKGKAAAKEAAAGSKQAKAEQPAQVGQLVWRATDSADSDEPDGRTALRAAELLEKHKSEPFFIAAGFVKPHLPFVAPRKYFDLYPVDEVRLPPQMAGDLDDIPAAALTHRKADTALSQAEQRQVVAAYQAATSFMDAQLGILLDAMDHLKLWDSTVVVFFGDHGWHLGEHAGLYRKMTVFEPSARVPLVVCAPGHKRGVRSGRLVELVDLYPTLADLCGLPAPQGLEGTSFVPLLNEPQRAWKKAAFTEVRRGRVMGRSLRTERYRYTEWDDGKSGVELYDHEQDQDEFMNVAKRTPESEAVEKMRELLRGGWQRALPP